MIRDSMLKTIFFTVFVVLTLHFSGCDESLPPREPPPVLYSTEARATYDYSFSPRSPQNSRNQINYIFVIKNIFDETIQDTLDFSGSITTTWLTISTAGEESTLSVSKTVPLYRSFIKYIRGYNSATGIMTFDPQDSIVIEYNWNFLTDDSTNLLEYFPSYPRGGKDGCKVTPKQTIRAFASISLMKGRGNIIVQPFDYTYCFFTAEGEPPCGDFIWDPCN